MQLPKKPHSPQSYKKKPISKESQQVNESTSQQVNKTTSQRVNEKSKYRNFEISRFRESRGYRLNFFNFLTP